MAHSPETPERYVCTDCLVVSAGVAENVDGDYRYEPPARCGACGGDAFVEEERFPHQTG